MSTIETEPAVPDSVRDSVAFAAEKREQQSTVLRDISFELSALQEAQKRALRISHPNVTNIVFDKTKSETMTARYENSTLFLSDNPLRTQALEQLSGLDSLLEHAIDGQVCIFKNGSWLALEAPVPIRR